MIHLKLSWLFVNIRRVDTGDLLTVGRLHPLVVDEEAGRLRPHAAIRRGQLNR